MEQTNLTNTEVSPQEAKDLGDQTTQESSDEKFRALQKKLDNKDQLILELQSKLKIEEELRQNLQVKIDNYELKLEREQQLNRELASDLRKALNERNSIESVLSKKKDILQLTCQQLEQRVGILESAEEARQEESHKKGDPETDEALKKLGLTENILLALPFGYTIKVRSAFEKLSYENEKLTKENEKLTRENAEILKKFAAQVTEMEQLKAETTSLYEVLKQCPGLTSLNNLEIQQRRNSEPLKEQGLSYEELKIRCGILAQINTSAMLNSRLRTTQPDSPSTSGSSPLNYQQRTQPVYHPDIRSPDYQQRTQPVYHPDIRSPDYQQRTQPLYHPDIRSPDHQQRTQPVYHPDIRCPDHQQRTQPVYHPDIRSPDGTDTFQAGINDPSKRNQK